MSSDTDPEGDEGWDDAVDVICVGGGAGVLAYRSVCAAADLDVLHVAAPSSYDEPTDAYLAAMTEDLVSPEPDASPAVIRAVPAPLRRDSRGRPDTLEPFVGQQLRDWSARCLASPSGVLFTEVPALLARMRTDCGRTITAAPVPGPAEADPCDEMFVGLVYLDGRLAGADVDGPWRRRRIRAEAGLVFGIGPGGPVPAGVNALVSRPAGRFARLETLEAGSA